MVEPGMVLGEFGLLWNTKLRSIAQGILSHDG